MILTVTLLAPSTQPFGETSALLSVRRLEPSWDLNLTLTLPRTGTLQGNLSLPRSLILHLSRLLAWALTSAFEGDHETRVASGLATSLDQTLTLAKARGPNSKV